MRRSGTIGPLVPVALAAAVLGAGCAAPRLAGPGKTPPNVVIVVLDTLRRDHVGAYGYARPTTPRIDLLAAAATRYTRAYTTAPWTVPSHGSLFTGKYPFEHGSHPYETKTSKGRGTFVSPLDPGNLTLAEVFRKEGYRTGAFVGNAAFMSPKWGLDQGFETYVSQRVTARELTDQALGWLEARGRESFFLFVNYIDIHSPKKLVARPELGETATDAEVDPERLDESISDYMLAGEEIPADLLQSQTDLYDTATANVDEEIGRLVDRLQQAGLYDNTILVVTSDHGQFIGEHGLVGHSKDVYEGVLRVPLVVKAPNQRMGRSEDGIIQLNDIPNLVFSLFPGDSAARYLQVFPDAPGGHPVIAEVYYGGAQTRLNRKLDVSNSRVRRVIIEWPLKYIDSSDGRHELYDLEADPGETVNLYDSRPADVERLERTLRGFMERRGSSPYTPVNPRLNEEDLRRLRSLGYVGG